MHSAQLLITFSLFVVAGTAINFMINDAVSKCTTPLMLSGLRNTLGGIVLGGAAFLLGARFPETTAWWRHALVGVFLFSIPHGLIFLALKSDRVDENDVALIDGLTPALLVVAGFVTHFGFHQTPPSWKLVPAIFFIAGLICFLKGRVRTLRWDLGHILLVASAIALAWALLLMNELCPRRHDQDSFQFFQNVLTDTALFAVFGGVFAFVSGWFLESKGRPLSNLFNQRLLRAALSLGLVGTVIGWSSGTWLNGISSLNAGIAIALIPLGTLLVKSWRQSERLSTLEWTGATLMISMTIPLSI